MTAPGEALEHGDRAGVFVGVPVGAGRVEVHVVVDGDPQDPAVATVHGIPGSTRDFRVFAACAVARGLCVVRIDLPGFGRSPPLPGRATFLTAPARRAQLIVDVMAARGHRRFAVVGHSFGGTAALATAALFPSSVTALALVNSVGITRHRGLQVPHELTRQVKHLAALPGVGPQLVEALLATYARMGIRSDKALDADDVIAHTELIGGLDFADLRAFAAAVTAPTLLASAHDDKLVEPTVTFALAQALSRASLVTHRHRRSGGHFLQRHDAPAIAAWLAARLSER